MWFISVYSLKYVISIGVIITLMMGIALLYVIVYGFLISSVAAQALPFFRNAFIGTFLTISVLLILSSLSALYGLMRKKNKYVIFYSITMIIYFVVFLLLGVFIASYPSYLKSECNDLTSEASPYRQAVAFANETLGKTCECNFNSQLKYTIRQLKILKKMGFTNYTIDQGLPINSENCDSWSNSTYTATNSMIVLENVFNCSGWCPTEPQFNLYFLFTDVNKGRPAQTCIQSLLHFFDEFGLIMAISTFSAAVVLFFVLMAILCLCCHPKRKHQYDVMKFFQSTLMVDLNEKEGSDTLIQQS